MPRKRPYFPVSQDINDDGQLWELTDKFGDRSLRIWLEICSILDKKENRWEMTEEGCKAIFRKTRIKPATGWQVTGWLLASHWLAAHQSVASELPLIYGAPNYWKFHPNAVPERFRLETLLPSFLPNSFHQNEKNPVPAPPGPHRKEPRKAEPERVSMGRDLMQQAIALGGTDTEAQQKLAQWVLSMTNAQRGEPTERIYAVTKASIEALKKQLDAGKKINDLWGYLTMIYNRERTKFIQEVEHARNKAPVPLEQLGDILGRVARKMG